MYSYITKKKQNNWLKYFVIFCVFQIFLYFLLFNFLINNRTDFFGVKELNEWVLTYQSLEYSNPTFRMMSGGNYFWIRFLDLFNLVPIDSYSKIIGICFISKIIQFSLFSFCFKFIGKGYWLLFVISLIPLNFLSMQGVGRSSLDISIISTIAVLNFYKPIFSFFLTGFSYLGKIILTYTGFLGFFLLNLKIKKNLKLLFVSVLFLIIYFLIVPDIIDLLQNAYFFKIKTAYFGSNALEIYPANEFLFFVRCFVSLLPPILFKVNVSTLLASIGHFAFYLIFYTYKRGFSLNLLFLPLFFIILGSPAMGNLITTSRYIFVLYSFIAVSLVIISQKNRREL